MRLPVTSHPLKGKASTSELINCYVEKLPRDAKASYLIRKCPGMRRLERDDTTSTFSAWNEILSMVYDPVLGDVFFIGSEGGGSGDAITIENFKYHGSGQFNNAGSTFSTPLLNIPYSDHSDIEINTAGDIVAVIQPNGYSAPLSGASRTLAQISDTDFTSRGAGDVEFLDNYFLFREPSTGRFFSADLGSSTAFDPLFFATAETSPDLLVGMKSDKAQLLLFGQSSIEIWDTTGGSGFPFRKMINGTIEKGCLSGRSIVLIDNSPFWIADDKTVRTLNGMQPVKVSNEAIEKIMQDDPAISSAKGMGWQFEGHSYYAFRTAQNCLVYDITTGAWIRRRSNGKESWDFQSALQTPQGPLFGGCNGNGWVSDISSDLYGNTEASSTVSNPEIAQEMLWTYQPVWGSGQRVFHKRLEIVLKTGVGNTNSPDPVIQLEASDDGGETWTALPDREIGAQGKRFQRVVWHNLGSSYQRVYRARVTEAVPITVTDTLLNAVGGSV